MDEKIEEKGIAQLIAERQGTTPRGPFSKSTAFQKSPTFMIDTPEASRMLQDKSGKGTHNRHAEYVKLADAHKDIQNGASLDQALKDNIGDDPLMGHGSATYTPLPEDKLRVYGRADPDVPIADDGRVYGKEVTMDQVEDIRKRHAAKQAAIKELQGATGGIGDVIAAAVKEPKMYVGDASAEDARMRNVQNAIDRQNGAVDRAKQILMDAGYPEDMVNQMLGL